MKTKKKLKYLSWFLTPILLIFIYTAISIRYYATNTFETESDVAIVLGAGTADGKLSKVFEQRVLHAINLLKSKKVTKLIFTGGYGKGQSISDAKAAKNYALNHGVSKDNVLIEEKSTITFFNIKNSMEIMKNNGLKTALVVSDPYHMKRSIHMCNLFGIISLPSPTPTSMYRSRRTKFKFLIKETWNYWAYLLIGQHRKIT